MNRWSNGQKDRQTDGHMDKWKVRQMNRWSNGQKDRQTDKWTKGELDGKTDRQIDRQMGR